MSEPRQPSGQESGSGDESSSQEPNGPSLSKSADQGLPAPSGQGGSTAYDPSGSGYPPPDQAGDAAGTDQGNAIPTYGDPSQQTYGDPSQQTYGPPPQGGQSAYGDAPPPPYGAPAPPAPGGYGAYGAPTGPGGTPPKKKRRTGLIIGLIAGGVVVLLALAIGLIAILAGGGDKPSATVKTYLQALSDGNATKALDQGGKPSDTTFLTDAALKTQQGVAKISNIDVSDGYSSGNRARVTATYKFGNKQADESFSLTKISGDWKLDATVYPIDLTSLDIPDLTLLGIKADGKDKAYVFPGPLTWGSSNDYYTVKDSGGADDFTLSPSDGSFSYTSLETDLSDTGQKAVADAVTTLLTTCAASKSLEPDNCPQAEYDYEGVDGTATWTPPSDLSTLQYQTGTPVNEVTVSGDLTWSVTYTAQDYSGAQKQVTVDDVDGSIYGTVDLSASPPAFVE